MRHMLPSNFQQWLPSIMEVLGSRINQFIDFTFLIILEIPTVVPSGVGKISVCIGMYVRGARAQTVPSIEIKFGRKILYHYTVSATEFIMDRLNRAGARN